MVSLFFLVNAAIVWPYLFGAGASICYFPESTLPSLRCVLGPYLCFLGCLSVRPRYPGLLPFCRQPHPGLLRSPHPPPFPCVVDVSFKEQRRSFLRVSLVILLVCADAKFLPWLKHLTKTVFLSHWLADS